MLLPLSSLAHLYLCNVQQSKERSRNAASSAINAVVFKSREMIRLKCGPSFPTESKLFSGERTGKKMSWGKIEDGMPIKSWNLLLSQHHCSSYIPATSQPSLTALSSA